MSIGPESTHTTRIIYDTALKWSIPSEFSPIDYGYRKENKKIYFKSIDDQVPPTITVVTIVDENPGGTFFTYIFLLNLNSSNANIGYGLFLFYRKHRKQ